MNTAQTRPRRQRVIASALAALLLVAGACGDDDDATATTSQDDDATTDEGTAPAPMGDPIRLMHIVDLTAPPGVQRWGDNAAGAEAAVTAINAAGGVPDPSGGPNRPIEMLECDAAGDPNTAADCARRAVDERVAAVVSSLSSQAEQFLPIVFEAGIPSVGGGAASTTDLTSPLSFPTNDPIGQLVAQALVTRARGGDSVQILQFDSAAVDGLMQIVEPTIEALGVSVEGITKVPPDATDLSTYAAQAVASDADGVVLILTQNPVTAVLNSMVQLGVDFDETTVAVLSNQLSDVELIDAGTAWDGIYTIGHGVAMSETENADVGQFTADLDAIGYDGIRNESAFQAWIGVQLVAQAAAELSTVDAASLTEVLNRTTMDRPGWSTVAFDTPAYSEAPLSAFRLFAQGFMVNRVQEGEVVQAVDDFITNGEDYDLAG